MNVVVLKKQLVVLSVGLGALAVSEAAEWHVALDGDDVNNCGSMSLPFRTIQKAAEVAVAGDYVYIHDGIYEETVVPANSGTSKNPIVFAPYPGEEVVVSGLETIPAGAWTEVSNGIYKAYVQMDLDTENQVFRTPSSVGFWRDRSGNENHAVQASAVSRPGANSTVVLDGVDDFLETPVGHFDNGGFLMVGNFAVQGSTNSSIVLSWQQSGSNPGMNYAFEDSSTHTVVSTFNNPNGGVFRNYTDGVSGALPSEGGWHIIGGTVESNGTDSAAFMRIGGNHNGSNFPDGSLRELIVWDKTISESDRQKLEGYLAHKWGLESNLDPAHPYKAAPPAAFDPAAVPGIAAWYDASSLDNAGEMMTEARWPNSLDVWNPAWAVADSGTTPSNLVDSALPDFDWTGATLCIHQDPAWSLYGQQVLGYGIGHLTTEDNAPWENHQLKPGSSYYVQGCLDALDIEGEWYYDSAGTLYVHTGGSNPGNSIEVKRRLNAFVLNDRSYLELHGLHIKGTTIAMNGGSSHITLDRLDIQYPYFSDQAVSGIGGASAQSNRGLVLNGDHHVFKNCELGWSSGSGLIIGGDDAYVVNNHIHDCDFIGTYAAPLKINGQTKGGVVSHNTISMAGRSCIAFGSPMADYLIQYNDLSHAGQLTQDLGMTYVNICEGGGTEIRYNWVHDNDSAHIASGIYFDHGSKNLLIHHNAIWGVDTGGLLVNQYAMGVLMFNNTITSADVGFRSVWGNQWPDDMYGCQLVNNVFNTTLYTDGVEIEIADNSTNYSGIVEHKYLTADSKPVDAGRIIPGITEGYVGGAPDRGAYEIGGMDWQAGHDFRNEPEVDATLSACPFKNRIANSCFEWSTMAPWTVSGSDVALNVQTVNQGMPLTQTAMGGTRSLRLGAGVNRTEQVLTNLLPNAMYEFRGRLRADAGEDAVIGVTGSGFGDGVSGVVSGNAPNWSDTRIRFATAPDSTSATIYAAKTSTGTGNVYIDDFSAIYQFSYLDQDFNAGTNGIILNSNGGVLDRTGSESDFTGVCGGASLEVENTSTNGNPEIRVDGIDMNRVGVGEPFRILFDYCRGETSGAQTFFLQDTVAPITGNGNGIQLKLNASDAGQVMNYGSSANLATLAVGTWYRFMIVAVPQTNAVKTFDLTISDTSGVIAAYSGLPFRNNIDSYNRVRWFFNTQNDNVQGHFYLDNVAVTGIASQEPVSAVGDPGADTDGDGMSDWAEGMAGTDPFDAASVLRINVFEPISSGNLVLKWSSESNRSYAVAGGTNLVHGQWAPLTSSIPATPPMNSKTVEVDQATQRFFRIDLE